MAKPSLPAARACRISGAMPAVLSLAKFIGISASPRHTGFGPAITVFQATCRFAHTAAATWAPAHRETHEASAADAGHRDKPHGREFRPPRARAATEPASCPTAHRRPDSSAHG